MEKMKNSLLSALLFSFVFLIVHDYAMVQVDTIASTHLTSETKTLTVDAQIHESIHMMIAMDIGHTTNTSILLDNKPSDIEHGFATHENYVLERPPLS